MKNLEKYKTTREREQAFVRFCGQHTCNSCPLDERRKVSACGCTFGWLEMEAEKELLPCPFCGEAPTLAHDGTLGIYYVKCLSGCHSMTEDFDTKEEAIAAWNRRAK